MTIRRFGTFVLALVLTLTGCSGGHAQDTQDSGVSVEDPEMRYGLGPVPDPATTYQPEVILIENGPRAIRSVSDDQFTWVLDANAKGVRELQPGKIMFASNQAVGRVMEVQPKGSDVAVTIAPVALGEVIRDGNFAVDQPIAVDKMIFEELPGLAKLMDSIEDTESEPTDPTESKDPSEPTEPKTSEPKTSEPTTTEPTTSPETTEPETPGTGESEPAGLMRRGTLRMPPLRMRAADDKSVWHFGEKAKVTVGDWEIEVIFKSGEVALNVQRSAFQGKKVGLRVGLQFKLSFDNPRMKANVPVQGGQVGNASYNLSGFKAISVDLSAGTDNGVADNTKVRVEVPVEIFSKNVLVYGVPTAVKLKAKFLVAAGFSQKQTTISSSGTIPLSGQLGLSGSALAVPAAAKTKALLDSLQGLTIGVTGFVATVDIKLSWGFGLSLASIGPYGKITASYGWALGSNAGIGGQQCKQVTMVVTGTAGVGVEASNKATDVIKKLFGGKIDMKKLESETQAVSKDIYRDTIYEPDIAMCRTT